MALGLVMAAAQGATPLAFAIAGTSTSSSVWLTWKMYAAYPVIGGGQYFTLEFGSRCGVDVGLHC